MTFQPLGKTVSVPVGMGLPDAARLAGVYLEHPCGARGICGKCQVEIEGRVCDPSAVETDLLSPDQLARGRRLSCQVQVAGPVRVRLIQDSPSAEVILQEGKEPSYEVSPAVKAVYLDLAEPAVEDQRSDEERVLDALRAAGEKPEPIPPEILRLLPERLRAAGWSITAILHCSRLLTIQPGDTRGRIFGIAVDLGTTTVVGSLHDLSTGHELARHGLTNEQVACGADIITRITSVGHRPDGLHILNRYAVSTLNKLIDRLARDGQVRKEEVYLVSLAGNTTMQQILLNINPTPIATSPFVPAFRRPTVWSARELGLKIHPDACLCVAPVVAAYVGGDIVADVLASAVYESEEPVLLVDLGTNAEIVLADRRRVLACACAAGPAFEGGEISQGMRAVRGAIERVWMEGDDLRVGVIGDDEPLGICGSGLVDALAVLLEQGAVDTSGRLLPPDEYEGAAGFRTRLRCQSQGVAVELWSDSTRSVCLTERDIRKLQLAKAAVKAGVKILCGEAGLSPPTISRVLIAGAFGSHLRPGSALRIGLIPPLDLARVHFVGNAAWVGAKMLLLSSAAAHRASRIIHETRYVELSGRSDFAEEFAESMPFDEDWQ